MPTHFNRIVQDPRLAQITVRDRTADGTFWYSVATTGVYCRPSCPSRHANPANIALHASPSAARAAGFRPCLRCRPDDPGPRSALVARIEAACRQIESAAEPPSLTRLAAAAGLSPGHFHRSFKAITGLTPKHYAEARRAGRLRAALPNAGGVTEAIYESGFQSSGRFYARSTALLGMTPTRYRAGGASETIRFAVGQCSLGAILVASSTQGVVAILLGDEPEALIHDLETRFPNATLIGDDPAYQSLIARVVGLIETPRQPADLALDIRGTAFQQRVWQALRAIPPGQTATYAEIARAIGTPSATRAVAGACAANTIAIAIPCHRVIRTDGTLSGYRWGIERKRRLLEQETTA
ncbi:bifunctional DNA-binding transcriptional regulator/O6-methylguanine-DNA methyltransferase Ada [Acidiphilium sp. PA]|uniref:bifunctional DNA-binding transcriptional regulator/O6-methylguanine-DNA methyltransferase Ada n=1 Tax=Acidiphilium sp. PA TaxID=2871705 RepID=UPI002244EDA0|nr:bifunctional DNA-binding transcriptional regulator/O6-methylguanine-DNA methyltransferase Ada [Acidiphilium sp. PA]MCW8305444.1 bifunctional DNA-binding transcriptional regulator/O6-methylguanine-DNA methyltransferase Ada [Acidiphilium sp. PA]